MARSILETELPASIVDELCYTNDFMWQIGSLDTELRPTCVGIFLYINYSLRTHIITQGFFKKLFVAFVSILEKI